MQFTFFYKAGRIAEGAVLAALALLVAAAFHIPLSHAEPPIGADKPKGMKHLRITGPNGQVPDQPGEEGANKQKHKQKTSKPLPTARKQKTGEAQQEKPPKLSQAKTVKDLRGQLGPMEKLEGKDHILPADQLKSFPYSYSLIAKSPAVTREALAEIRKNSGRVPPAALVLAAHRHFQAGSTARAALYLYTAQLRARFDALRWPGQSDQSPARKNREVFMRLLQDYAGPIRKWTLETPERAFALLSLVRQFDAATPYAYRPGYDIPRSVPYTRWQGYHEQARETFFDEASRIIEALQSMRR